jgi:hypothetical protein
LRGLARALIALATLASTACGVVLGIEDLRALPGSPSGDAGIDRAAPDASDGGG